MTDHAPRSHHPDLLAFLRGELSTDEVMEVRDHAAECPECRAELLELAVGHSLLSATSRSLATPAPVVPPTQPAAPVPRPPRRGRRIVLGVAAAVLVATGAGIAGVLLEGEVDPPPAPSQPVAEAQLDGVGAYTGRGRVTMTGTEVATMTVETTDLPPPRDGSYYYVWLLDPETNKMLPIGQVQADGSTTFHLPLSLLRNYSAIDVSLEADNGDPGHSVTSVLRADYQPPGAT